jgi:multidrug efflux pump subunit AcrA (membrane-fusion protein)
MDVDRATAIEAQLVEARRALNEARRAATDAELVLRQREAAVSVLERELNRAESTAPASLEGLDRTDAIVALLERAGEPLGPKEIRQLLEDNGWGSQQDTVISATLTHLVKNGRIRRPSRAKYVPAHA